MQRIKDKESAQKFREMIIDGSQGQEATRVRKMRFKLFSWQLLNKDILRNRFDVF